MGNETEKVSVCIRLCVLTGKAWWAFASGVVPTYTNDERTARLLAGNRRTPDTTDTPTELKE